MSHINDPYKETVEREQDLLHQRETERIKFVHQRRLKIIELFTNQWPGMIGMVILGTMIVGSMLIFPSCNMANIEAEQRKRDVIDTCIREGTNPEACKCAFDWVHADCVE